MLRKILWMLLLVALFAFDAEAVKFGFWLMDYPDDLYLFGGMALIAFLILGNGMLFFHFSTKWYKALKTAAQSYYTKQRGTEDNAKDNFIG